MTTTTYTYYPNTVGSLFTAHSSQAEIYAFSAKERDTETGLSYFGARYYSSDLSIWLSVDPMADKYPSLSPYTYCADNPVKLVDPEGEDPIYTKNFWGKIKKIGDDGKCCTGSYLVRGSAARKVRSATKKGDFYTGNLSASDNVVHVPTGQVLNDVQSSVTQSLESGASPDERVEFGGHALENDIHARIWDPGKSTQTKEFSDGTIMKKRTITPFLINGKKYQLGGPPQTIEFIWHVHTETSSPSRADYEYAYTWQNVANVSVFILCPNDKKVSYYNGKRVIFRIKYDDFKKMGRQED